MVTPSADDPISLHSSGTAAAVAEMQVILRDLHELDAATARAAASKIAPALVRLGNLLCDDDEVATARRLFGEMLAFAPGEYAILLRLGELELDEGEFASALDYLHRAAACTVVEPTVYKHLACTYERLRDYPNADAMWRLGYPNAALTREYLESSGKPRLLAILTSLWGNIPFRKFIRPDDFDVSTILAESYHPGIALEEYDVLFLAVGDPDLCPRALQKARAIRDATGAPMMNEPDRVALTGRSQTAERLRALPGVETARIEHFIRAELMPGDAAANLANRGFALPVLLRTPGYHTGQKFELVNSLQELSLAVDTLPGADFFVLSFLDTAHADGTFRKYRMMRIGKTLYPVHLAISYHWKVHYFSAEMETHPEFRAEEERYLCDPAAVLGAQNMKNLEEVFAMLDLDYAGADFALDTHGRIVIYEANPGMLIQMPNDDPKWAYRRPALRRALDAARRLTLMKSGIAVTDPAVAEPIDWPASA